MKYFTFTEFERSATAARLKIDNRIPGELRQNAQALVEAVLDPLRQTWGRPIAITSGYRCPALNRAVGGSAASHHMRAMAADITAGSRDDNRRLYNLVLELRLPFTQLIDEKNYRWLHVSYDPYDLRRQTLRL